MDLHDSLDPERGHPLDVPLIKPNRATAVDRVRDCDSGNIPGARSQQSLETKHTRLYQRYRDRLLRLNGE
jgi:hypothetical protein